MRALRLFAVAAPFAVALVVADARANADDVAPLEVSAVGEGTIRVRVSQGVTTPCDSSDDAPLASELVDANQSLVVKTDAVCLCIDHTSAPFTETGWSPSTIYCRPCRHTGGKRCVTDMTAPFHVVVPTKS